MKNKKIKAGYYVEKDDGFIYLYDAETKQWTYLPSDSIDDDDEIGVAIYDSDDLLKRCKYIGNTINDLVKYVVNEKLAD